MGVDYVCVESVDEGFAEGAFTVVQFKVAVDPCSISAQSMRSRCARDVQAASTLTCIIDQSVQPPILVPYILHDPLEPIFIPQITLNNNYL